MQFITSIYLINEEPYWMFAGNNNQESAFTDSHLSIEELSTSPAENTQQSNGVLTTFKSSSKEGMLQRCTHILSAFSLL